MPPSPALRLLEVSKSYGSQQALDNVSLEVAPGTVTALLGENGAGKTTMLKILLGLEHPDQGRSEVLLLDSRTHGHELRARIGYVPERPALYEWMTVGQIGWFTAGFYRPGYQDEFFRLARQFELPLDRRIKHLSKGMRAKVALALAMGHRPEVLILDEPTSGLDSLVRREFLASMVDWAAEGRTVFLSSHQIPEVERVADQVVILHRGRLVLSEPLDQLKAEVRELTIQPVNGAPPPVLPGEILRQEQRRRQWRVIVRGLPEHELAALRTNSAIESVEVNTPSLDEVYVAYLSRTGLAASPAKEQP